MRRPVIDIYGSVDGTDLGISGHCGARHRRRGPYTICRAAAI